LDVSYNEERNEIVIRKVLEHRKTFKAERKLTSEEIEELIKSGLKENA